MIAEDQPIIGLDLSDCLASAGFTVAGPFASCAASLAWLEAHTPDLAVLDYALDDGDCAEVIDTLIARGIPTIVLSGYIRESDAPPSLRKAIWLVKPCDHDTVLAATARLVPSLDIETQSPLESVVCGSAAHQQ
jgi:DNA-binding response OmpR family regulator